jgi:hypothetical protein
MYLNEVFDSLQRGKFPLPSNSKWLAADQFLEERQALQPGMGWIMPGITNVPVDLSGLLARIEFLIHCESSKVVIGRLARLDENVRNGLLTHTTPLSLTRGCVVFVPNIPLPYLTLAVCQ